MFVEADITISNKITAALEAVSDPGFLLLSDLESSHKCFFVLCIAAAPEPVFMSDTFLAVRFLLRH